MDDVVIKKTQKKTENARNKERIYQQARVSNRKALCKRMRLNDG